MFKAHTASTLSVTQLGNVPSLSLPSVFNPCPCRLCSNSAHWSYPFRFPLTVRGPWSSVRVSAYVLSVRLARSEFSGRSVFRVLPSVIRPCTFRSSVPWVVRGPWSSARVPLTVRCPWSSVRVSACVPSVRVARSKFSGRSVFRVLPSVIRPCPFRGSVPWTVRGPWSSVRVPWTVRGPCSSVRVLSVSIPPVDGPWSVFVRQCLARASSVVLFVIRFKLAQKGGTPGIETAPARRNPPAEFSRER